MEVKNEITLKSFGVLSSNIEKRELVKIICISLGLLQEKDKRDVIVDVVYILNLAQKNNELLSSEEIQKKVIDIRNNLNLDLKGTAPSNIRRILKTLIDYGLIERKSSKYFFKGNKKPDEIFKEIIELKIKPILKRNIQYLSKL